MRQRRRDPLTGAWRAFDDAAGPSAATDEPCALCPTSDPARPTSVPWPTFDVAVIEEPAVSAAPDGGRILGERGYESAVVAGAREVVVYSPDHGVALGELGVARARLVVDVWADRYDRLGRRPDVGYVLISESWSAEGAAHACARLAASGDPPPAAQVELERAAAHMARHGTCLLCDVVARERAEAVRLVARSSAFLAFVPFAGQGSGEVHVVSHRHVPSLLDLSDPERDDLAGMLVDLDRRFARLFGPGARRTMAVHQAPTDDGEWQSVSHLHVELTAHRTGAPDETASSEWDAGTAQPVRVPLPEVAAARLRAAGPGTW